jgi:hypothetical protein
MIQLSIPDETAWKVQETLRQHARLLGVSNPDYAPFMQLAEQLKLSIHAVIQQQKLKAKDPEPPPPIERDKSGKSAGAAEGPGC